MTPRHFSISTVLLSVATVVVLAGCSVADPYRDAATSSSPPTARAGRSSSTPAVVIRRFAKDYINWTADDLASNQARLAHLATGSLRDDLQKAVQLIRSPAAAKDGLPFAGRANRGTVEVVQVGRGGHFYVVTHETADLAALGSQTTFVVYTGLVIEGDGEILIAGFRAVS